MRIAVLNSDSAQAELACRTLEAAGHSCQSYGAGADLLRALRRHTIDLLVLDWNVPDMPGVDVLRWVRANLSERLPVLFTTPPQRESEIAPLLNTGADDYVVKPLAAGVLLARVDALLRRAWGVKAPAAREVFGEFEFDLLARHVVVRGKTVAMTQKEFELAWLLFQHLNRPLSRAQILDVVWKRATDLPSRSMDTHVSTLRNKLGLRPEHGYRLTPIYGFGYRLERLEQGKPGEAGTLPAASSAALAVTGAPPLRGGRSETGEA